MNLTAHRFYASVFATSDRFCEIQDSLCANIIRLFENSRRATYVQREYARRNPMSSKAIARFAGVLRCEGPGRRCYPKNERVFFDSCRAGFRRARDGTWRLGRGAPLLQSCSSTIEHSRIEVASSILGLEATFNPTFRTTNVVRAAGFRPGTTEYPGTDCADDETIVLTSVAIDAKLVI